MDGPAHFDPSVTPAPGGLKAPDDLPRALADLRASGWESVPVADEMRRNTAKAIAAGHSLVPGVLGFEDTVVPQLENAILAGHDLILLVAVLFTCVSAQFFEDTEMVSFRKRWTS